MKKTGFTFGFLFWIFVAYTQPSVGLINTDPLGTDRSWISQVDPGIFKPVVVDSVRSEKILKKDTVLQPARKSHASNSERKKKAANLLPGIRGIFRILLPVPIPIRLLISDME